ncbi:MAG TPA: hypothetical protein VMN35_03020 [Gaiellaceae bacterium]|nr:hypothetical protein [Gaiellaceae bacterium]
MSVASASVSVAREAGRTVDRLLEHPRAVLATLAGAQIGATVLLAIAVEHNGWVWFQGGDQIGNVTTGWLVGQLELPPTQVSYVWPLVLAPITWVTGPTFLQVLPPLIALQVLVLGPIALVCVYAIAARIGGRLLGYWATLLWVVAPFAVIPLFVDRYQERWSEQFLPQPLGLTAMPDFPSTVVLLVTALFVVRALSDGHVPDAALAGLLAGAAGGLKPPNYLFLAGALLAFAVVRRWREAVVFSALVAPSILLLALWKYRGLGDLPALTVEQTRIAAGAGLPAIDVDRYIDLDLDHWRAQMDHLREFFWSPRLAQWAPFAGLLAVLRVRRGAIAALLAGWLTAFLVVKGFSPRADIQANTFWRLLMPAWPAYLLLIASIPLLVPTLARRLGDRLDQPPSSAVRLRWVVAAGVATILVPSVAIAASSRIGPPEPPAIVQEFPNATTILTPVDEDIELRVERDGAAHRLSWSDPSWRASVFYRVYRTEGTGSDLHCVTEGAVAWNCFLSSSPLGTTRDRQLVDEAPVAGATYRLGVGTNWADDPEAGDIFVFSPPAAADP